ncbi:hypothetical protein HYPSUDRAFT_198510 [Hypholoma sublateritium FD-334 SS-4]|uniref:Uncharacterized protein n=1 Tax=Hypholoma sublateritium (strain FD-334 SS-4) TaxID=945553 RepID=A0A0D2LHZ8_HYPSF|nr:hypothetical protein HYPSUDRAFT_198510 [Hypholoma sublateritium FD-334 SS-4]
MQIILNLMANLFRESHASPHISTDRSLHCDTTAPGPDKNHTKRPGPASHPGPNATSPSHQVQRKLRTRAPARNDASPLLHSPAYSSTYLPTLQSPNSRDNLHTPAAPPRPLGLTARRAPAPSSHARTHAYARTPANSAQKKAPRGSHPPQQRPPDGAPQEPQAASLTSPSKQASPPK